MAGGAVVTPSISNRPYLKGRQLIYPLFLAISLFFLWGFSYGLLDVLNKHFQNVLKITKLESTGLQIVYFGGGYFFFSPIAAELLKRKGYKITIVLGLVLYALGAIFFWPTARFSNPDNAKQAFGGFIVCTFVIACGLATLETAANSYVTIIGDPRSASMRLQFCQSWNGVASFIGPLIASKLFFSGENANNLDNVQYVYIAVACSAVLVAILFIFSKLPEVDVDEEDPTVDNDETSKPLWKQYNMIFAFIAQFCYVGAQVKKNKHRTRMPILDLLDDFRLRYSKIFI
jgi:FHS family L-fucose permease-like MFS transporter